MCSSKIASQIIVSLILFTYLHILILDAPNLHCFLTLQCEVSDSFALSSPSDLSRKKGQTPIFTAHLLRTTSFHLYQIFDKEPIP